MQKYIYYLQAGAQEKYLIKDLKVLKKRLVIIELGYMKWLKYNPDFAHLKNPETKYKTIMEKRKVIRQIEALEYLID